MSLRVRLKLVTFGVLFASSSCQIDTLYSRGLCFCAFVLLCPHLSMVGAHGVHFAVSDAILRCFPSIDNAIKGQWPNAFCHHSTHHTFCPFWWFNLCATCATPAGAPNLTKCCQTKKKQAGVFAADNLVILNY